MEASSQVLLESVMGVIIVLKHMLEHSGPGDLCGCNVLIT